MENCGEYEKESWAMSEDEKLKSIPVLKAKGNAHYAAGEYDEAVKEYCEALGRLDQMMIREKPEDEEWLQLENLKIPLLLNYSQCKLIQKDFYSVIEHTTTVLTRYPGKNPYLCLCTGYALLVAFFQFLVSSSIYTELSMINY